MNIKNSIHAEPPATGAIPHILISYYRTTMEIEEYNLVSRLITDLQSLGIDVLIDEIKDINISPTANLQPYDWILLIQTKDASSFELVKERQAKALNQGAGEHLQRVLHILVSASPAQTTIATSDIPNTFDARIDYQRAFAGIVLMIYPNNRSRLYGIERGVATSDIAPQSRFSGVITDLLFRSRRGAGRRHPLYILFIALAVLLLFGVTILHSFALSSTKTPIVRTTPIKMPTVKAVTNNHHIKPAKAISHQEALYIQATSQKPVINDSLHGQSANRWDVTQQQGASCAFIKGSYHISILPPSQPSTRYPCLANRPIFANLALQVNMKLLQGDVGGLIFRSHGHTAYSWFSLDTHGCYRLVLFTPNGQVKILSNDQNSCLRINMHNTNQLTVLAQGSNIYLYINRKFIHQFSDPSLTQGGIGLLAIKRTQSTNVAFTHLKVWRLA